MTFDLLIKGGTIFDGAGKPRFPGDIGISDGRIKAVGSPELAGAKATAVISAAGKFVTPGFVDLTSHADQNWALFSNPGSDYLLTQGVTTILVGNCGSSLAPLASPEAGESIRKWTSLPGLNVNWATVAEFLGELSRHPLGVNVGTLVGHGTLRRGILRGEARRMNREELAQCLELLTRSIKEGAFGMSSGLIYSHEAPAGPDELAALARALVGAGAVYKPHLRHEGANLVPAMSELLQLTRETRVTTIVSHLKAIGRKTWPYFRNVIEMIERENESGRTLLFDISPYQRTGSFLYLLLPRWSREGGFLPMLGLIRTPESRARILADLTGQTIRPERYIVASSRAPGANGKTIAEIAETSGVSPEEAILDLLSSSNGRVTVFGRTLSYKNLTLALAHPLAMVASDGSGVSREVGQSGALVHPRSTGTFPHFLHFFVRERELMHWEEGIRKITSRPAEAVGFEKRGRIEEGWHADIAVFDPEVVRDRSTYQNPYVHAVGFDAVIVNGKLAVENGRPIGVAAGQVLKKT